VTVVTDSTIQAREAARLIGFVLSVPAPLGTALPSAYREIA